MLLVFGGDADASSTARTQPPQIYPHPKYWNPYAAGFISYTFDPNRTFGDAGDFIYDENAADSDYEIAPTGD